ncbi:MAG: hypothetical protein RLZZ272_1463 [Actinomycetota bacterium]
MSTTTTTTRTAKGRTAGPTSGRRASRTTDRDALRTTDRAARRSTGRDRDADRPSDLGAEPADPAAQLRLADDPASPTSGPAPSPTRDLGIAGWTRLDPLLLAALALEGPLLLVGAHGTAKTLLVERIAGALGADFRHYNASLLNYDDLVGIPIPDEAGGLRFVGTEGAVWGAGFVFFDEINRCRPDLQNKMFPIVHERRIGGIALSDLVHRWAAMNPPQVGGGDAGGYVGTEPLDEALADRFWFVVRTPTWGDLGLEERLALLEGGTATVIPEAAATGAPATGASAIEAAAPVAPVAPDASDLATLVARTRETLARVEAVHGHDTTRYVVSLVDTLASGGVALSPRRARILRSTLLATLAAEQVLGRDLPVGDVFELVVLNGLPHWADVEPPEASRVIGAHLHAFDLAFGDHDGSRARLLAEPDAVRRIRLALDLGLDEPVIATTVTAALASLDTDAERSVLSAVLFHALARRPLTPAAWSAIHEGATPILGAGPHASYVPVGPTLDAWREAVAWLESAPRTRFEQAVIHGLGPDGLRGVGLARLLDRLHAWTTLFELSRRVSR